MDTLEAIASRRSIRNFKDRSITDEDLNTILKAAIQSPSGSNRQPWRFVVIGKDKRAEMLKVFRDKLEARKAAGENTAGPEKTAGFMEQAPITVFVFYPDGKHYAEPRTPEEARRDLIDIQSIGAAIQNMLLAAYDVGIGSLWIGHVFTAYEEICEWLGEQGEMIAAVSFGYAAETPDAKPRKPLSEVVRWL
jgi:nitroreductase